MAYTPPRRTTNLPLRPTAETTFRFFDINQAIDYAEHRSDYHSDLYKIILDHHLVSGGELGTILDVGCGPGIVTRSLAPYFKRAIGVDASRAMIAAARSLTKPPNSIQFENLPIEQLGQVNNDPTLLFGPPILDGSVDLLTVASAVHWFDMAAFWATTARLVKPGGSVALFANTSIVVDPALNSHISPTDPSTFHKIQTALDRIFNHLDEHMSPGNRLLHNLYRDLYLPWTLPNPDPAVASEFDEASFFRKEWTGVLEKDGSLFQDNTSFSLDQLESFIGTISPYVRWRFAHQEEAGGPKDPSKLVRKEIEEALAGGGVDPSFIVLNISFTGVLLIVEKKKKE